MSTQILRPVQLAWSFRSPPAIVFDAWISPRQMRRWMFLGETNAIALVRAGKRVGDRFLVRERAEGEEFDHFGTYLEINPPKRLVFTLEVPKHFRGSTTVTVAIEPDGASGSRMTFTQTGVDPDVTEPAWRGMFQTLERVLDEPLAAVAG